MQNHSNKKSRQLWQEASSSILDNTADGVVCVDADQRICGFNRGAQSIFGYAEEEILGRPLDTLIPERFRANHFAYCEEFSGDSAVSRSMSERTVLVGLHASGREIFVDITIGKFIHDDILLTWAIVRDQTQRMRLLQELELSNSLSRNLLDIADLRSALAYVARELQRYAGWEYAELWVPTTQDERLVLSSAWHSNDPRLQRFARDSRSFSFRKNEGLPGRVWVSGKPEWIRDLSASTEQDYWRKNLAMECGLYCTASLPVFGNDTIHGILCFYLSETPMEFEVEIATIETLLENIRNIIRHKAVAADLYSIANFDTLTGLPNARLFLDLAERSMSSGRTSRRRTGVVAIAIDTYGELVASHGLDLAEKMLKAVAGRVAKAVRAGDIVARTETDRFVVASTLRKDRDVGVVLRKIAKQVRAPLRIEGHDILMRTTAGVSISPKDGSDPRTLLQHAETALVAAQQTGESTHEFYRPSLSRSVRRKLSHEAVLRRALENDEFCPYFQAILDPASFEVVGLEALARWLPRANKIRTPDSFLETAEEASLITEIDESILRHVSTSNGRWARSMSKHWRVAVNLSPAWFRTRSYTNKLLRILDASDAAEYITVEITERGLIENFNQARKALTALHERGIDVALDDFGTGYSSLAYLANLPIHALKVDRSFVAGMTGDVAQAGIVQTVRAIAGHLNKQAIAEGIETEEQLTFIRAYGFNGVQGYLFGEPCDGEAMTELLKTEPFARRDAKPS